MTPEVPNYCSVGKVEFTRAGVTIKRIRRTSYGREVWELDRGDLYDEVSTFHGYSCQDMVELAVAEKIIPSSYAPNL